MKIFHKKKFYLGIFRIFIPIIVWIPIWLFIFPLMNIDYGSIYFYVLIFFVFLGSVPNVFMGIKVIRSSMQK